MTLTRVSSIVARLNWINSVLWGLSNQMQAELMKAGITLIVGLALAYFGLRIYFRQREYELVKQRYLEQSLDVISGDLEAISSAFNHNWAHCLNILKEYRDAPGTFDQAHLSQLITDFRF
jgi:uncharacterized membrane-anchored protein YhcB (DUF1043 family)